MEAEGTLTDNTLLDFYKEHLEKVLLPFWKLAVDKDNGGVFTCFNNTGGQLISHDKYTWSQGRYIWIWSRIARLCEKGLINDSPQFYIDQAKKTVDFLWEHAILPNGHCAFILTKDGTPKESQPGAGYDTSFYADCFVIVGFSEYARATGDIETLNKALQIYDTVKRRVRSHNFRSEPYPIPVGLEAHSVPMILLNVSQELLEGLKTVNHNWESEIKKDCEYFADQILNKFRLEDGRIAEMTNINTEQYNDTILMRHFNPGHTIEDMWFLIHLSFQLDKPEWIDLAVESIQKALELGWDEQYGGLLRFVDREGGQPRGKVSGVPYEKLIVDTWDTKLWWPHSEALYGTLLAKRLTDDSNWDAWYQTMHNYIFNTFPNPNKIIGEWIQIRDRKGNPINKLVALPVKDPFHIIRDVLLIIELLGTPKLFLRGQAK
ncbi:AGE family epimerase/isomerase [Cytobacillus sp. Hz8]|uniref:AGE family epimerase/isomerase n=1 Tax=Cytobacillus sp. Hz8 TaxID=3347168 RepID=UPI0035D70229